MKKNILLIIGLLIAIPSFASHSLHPFLHKLTHQNSKSIRNPTTLGQTDFSGNWVGVCQSEPEEEDNVMITNSDTGLTMNGKELLINGISTSESKSNEQSEHFSAHLRWNENQTSLLGTVIGYSHEGDLSQDDFSTYTGKASLSLENNQLIINVDYYVFKDGKFLAKFKDECRYNKQPVG